MIGVGRPCLEVDDFGAPGGAVERLLVVGVPLRKLPGVDACEFMRTGWAPPSGLSFWCFASERLPVSSGSNPLDPSGGPGTGGHNTGANIKKY